jgi:hypothetical protein
VLKSQQAIPITEQIQPKTGHFLSGNQHLPTSSFIATSFVSSALINADDTKEVRQRTVGNESKTATAFFIGRSTIIMLFVTSFFVSCSRLLRIKTVN